MTGSAVRSRPGSATSPGRPTAADVCPHRRCRAKIRHAKTVDGEQIAVDYTPDPDGRLVWTMRAPGDWRMRALADGETPPADGRGWTAHAGTCPGQSRTVPDAALTPAGRVPAPRQPAPDTPVTGAAALAAAGLDPQPVGRRLHAVPGPSTATAPRPGGTSGRALEDAPPLPPLAELGAGQDPAARTCPACGAVSPAALPHLDGEGGPALVDLQAGLYDLIALWDGRRWAVRAVAAGEDGLPFSHRVARHICRTYPHRCQTPGHETEPARLYPGGTFCDPCAESRSRR
ncbi:hypothetical protein [Actinoplanes sp. NBRC 101535]|uniref:hypothetical protein n=1 Tax=Actinoplanes sp. NBRC 101535 TaxID=3032196 RepID=UPI00249FD115|nr:hypothetical protein [Actinoplanes sp. NBRC 101535]GLY08326.1 hypothetical protein Acsp01_87050 [Actinoplanes sp. NBRC 101535]